MREKHLVSDITSTQLLKLDTQTSLTAFSLFLYLSSSNHPMYSANSTSSCLLNSSLFLHMNFCYRGSQFHYFSLRHLHLLHLFLLSSNRSPHHSHGKPDHASFYLKHSNCLQNEVHAWMSHTRSSICGSHSSLSLILGHFSHMLSLIASHDFRPLYTWLPLPEVTFLTCAAKTFCFYYN